MRIKVFQYKDQLGNIRLSYKNTGNGLEIVQENNYYPFGMQHKGYNEQVNEKEYPYKTYQGQELNKELGLNWLSFKYRNYDPAIGRFMSVDPLAAKYPYNGVYNFSENRVIDGVELEGLEAIRIISGGLSWIRTKDYTKTEQFLAEFGASILHPIAALRIGKYKRGGTNITSVTGRIARHMENNSNMTSGIGGESNAFRHVLWSATLTNLFGSETATDITNAHEATKVTQVLMIDFNRPLIQNLGYADSVDDILNNMIGREIGNSLSEGTSIKNIAKEVMRRFYSQGFWTTSKDNTGILKVGRNQISQGQYKRSLKILKSLNVKGFSSEDLKDLESD